MAEKLNAGICWKSFQYNNINHINNLNDEGFTFLRIFVDLADFPQKTPDNSYMVNIFNMPDGMWAWDNFSKRWWSAAANDKVKNAFDYCKNNNKLPIVSFGHSEEKQSWISRSPSPDKLPWLTLMATEFAEYLKLAYNFTRVDMESWNEPNECMSPSVYAQVTAALSKGWRTVYPYSWVHGFASNLSEQNYLNDLLAIPVFVKSVNAISPHILTDAEWNQPLINGTYDKCFNKGLKVTYLEVSPLADLNRLHMLIDKCSMYAVVLWIRNSIIGQGDGITITDALIYDFENPNSFISVNEAAMDFITTFNKDHTVGVDMSVPTVPIPPAVTTPWLSPSTHLTANFTWGEFWCQGKEPPKELYTNIFNLAVQLQILRDFFKCPVTIRSGWRTAAHNHAVGGALNSQHLVGKGADIFINRTPTIPTWQVGYYAARYCPLINGIGVGPTTYNHLDIRDEFTPFKE